MNIITNFCGQCTGSTPLAQLDNCISSWTLRCKAITLSQVSFQGDDCSGSTLCNCDIMSNNIVYTDDITDEYCITDQIKCETDPDCFIDCSSTGNVSFQVLCF